jgi:hypothetical protein
VDPHSLGRLDTAAGQGSQATARDVGAHEVEAPAADRRVADRQDLPDEHLLGTGDIAEPTTECNATDFKVRIVAKFGQYPVQPLVDRRQCGLVVAIFQEREQQDS